jgi:lipoate-protein ligase A
VAARWRLLVDGRAPGPWNMGVDEALLATAAAGGPASLRLYRWDGPWLSLGYAQADGAARRGACARAGVGVVRRTTGGRAVLHGADLTYAVAAPEAWLPAGLEASYALLADALEAALRGLGVAVDRTPAARAGARGLAEFDCFAGPAGHELCAGGRKLVGSAQRRSGGGILQHGSIRLAPDPEAARRATGLAGEGATSLAELGVACTPERLGAAVAEALAARLGAELEPGGLDPVERHRAARRGESTPIRATPYPSQGAHPLADTERGRGV